MTLSGLESSYETRELDKDAQRLSAALTAIKKREENGAGGLLVWCVLMPFLVSLAALFTVEAIDAQAGHPMPTLGAVTETVRSFSVLGPLIVFIIGMIMTTAFFNLFLRPKIRASELAGLRQLLASFRDPQAVVKRLRRTDQDVCASLDWYGVEVRAILRSAKPFHPDDIVC